MAVSDYRYRGAWLTKIEDGGAQFQLATFKLATFKLPTFKLAT